MIVMDKQLTHKLIERFPFIPSKNPLYFGNTNVPMSVDCDDGWFSLLWELCEHIETELKIHPEERVMFSVDQVKEKFAGLRFYASGGTDVIYELIAEAEKKSYTICEICGRMGKPMVRGGWYKTLCHEHSKEFGFIEIETVVKNNV